MDKEEVQLLVNYLVLQGFDRICINKHLNGDIFNEEIQKAIDIYMVHVK